MTEGQVDPAVPTPAPSSGTGTSISLRRNSRRNAARDIDPDSRTRPLDSMTATVVPRCNNVGEEHTPKANILGEAFSWFQDEAAATETDIAPLPDTSQRLLANTIKALNDDPPPINLDTALLSATMSSEMDHDQPPITTDLASSSETATEHTAAAVAGTSETPAPPLLKGTSPPPQPEIASYHPSTATALNTHSDGNGRVSTNPSVTAIPTQITHAQHKQFLADSRVEQAMLFSNDQRVEKLQHTRFLLENNLWATIEEARFVMADNARLICKLARSEEALATANRELACSKADFVVLASRLSAHEGPGQTLDHKRVTAHQRGMLQQASATQAMLHRQLLQHQIRPELVAPFIPQADMPSLFIPQEAALTSHQRRLRSHIQEAQPDAGISSNISIPPPPGGPASTVAFAVGPHIPAASTQIRFVGRAGMTLLLNKPL
ncbi:MAG: hypothetical protein WDW38_006676 [Sanguina aurantia]